MRGLVRFLGKETVEFARTWRVWVLGCFLLFFALASPVLAKLTPEILASVGAGQPGVVITIPDPTWRDAYLQWIKNLSQMGSLLVIVLSAGSVAGEIAAGTAQLVLTKPVSRAWFVVAKVLALVAFVAVLTTVGTAVMQAATALVFGEAPTGDLWLATGVWLLGAALMVTVTVLASTAFPTLASVGVGVGVLLLLPAAGIYRPLAENSPAGLLGAPGALVAGQNPELLVPMLSTVVLSVLLTACACAVFARREI